MDFRIGEKVAYPNHGVCKIEGVEKKRIKEFSSKFYSLRVLANDSLIFVPVDNAETIGVRPIINAADCRRVMEFLSGEFDDPDDDWKIRTRNLSTKLQTGDIFEAADVLKKLSFRARLKKLSFREQRMFEKAKFLVVSELAVVCSQAECQIEAKVDGLLNCACEHHNSENTKAAAATSH